MNDHSERMGYEGYWQIAQVSPFASLMYPLSPQAVLHEFLTIQKSSVDPTKRTPWLMLVLQLLMTPPLQSDQVVASTATARGLSERAFSRSSHPQTLTQSSIGSVLGTFCLHQLSLAVQTQSASEAIPWSMMYSQAESIHPPPQPLLPYDREQSTRSCSEKVVRSSFLILERLSRAPVAAKAQHEPQAP